MHEKRRRIMDIIKEQGSATVNELRNQLAVTGVTVRHHLDVLHSQGLVTEPKVRRRKLPGRPQYEYRLTEKAAEHFPKRYDVLALNLMHEIKCGDSPLELSAVLDGVRRRISSVAPKPEQGNSLEEQVDNAVEFLKEQGYEARREKSIQGLVIHIGNCPYENLPQQHPELCQMDSNLVTSMIETQPECMGVMATGYKTCSYLIRDEENSLLHV